MLNEMFQQRGDEDSRRYRVFQHYLRNTKNGRKRKVKIKKENKKNLQDNDLGHLSWSSSSSNSNDNMDAVPTSKISLIKTKFLERKKSLNSSGKLD